MRDLKQKFAMSKFASSGDRNKAMIDFMASQREEIHKLKIFMDRAWDIVVKSDFYSRDEVLELLECREPSDDK